MKENADIHLDTSPHVDFLDRFVGYIGNASAWARTVHEVAQLDVTDLDRGCGRACWERMGKLRARQRRGWSVM